MDFIRHSTNWVLGEIFEMIFIAIAGMALIAIAFAFAKFGVTPLAKALLIPLAVVGFFYATLGAAGCANNLRRIPAFTQACDENASAFIVAEKSRVEGFQYGYRITNIVAPVCFALATSLFWFSLNSHARAIGIALVIFALFGFFIDAFSKERADSYYTKILEELANPGLTAL